jgi:hypothetical protein
MVMIRIYVLTTLLKIDLDTQTKAPVIEMRQPERKWEMNLRV